MTVHHHDHVEKAMSDSRQTILGRLKTAERILHPDYPAMPPSPFLSMNHKDMVEILVRNLTEQGAEVHRAEGHENLRQTIDRVIADQGFSRIMVSEDPFMENLKLESHAENHCAEFIKPSDLEGNEQYKGTVFSVDAGLTTVDAAVAESGTLVIAHNKTQSRLISLAPLVHLAVVRTGTVVPVYEKALDLVIPNGGLPSQLTFITGPSMTADIMATPFRGMHGPRRLVVFLVDT